MGVFFCLYFHVWERWWWHYKGCPDARLSRRRGPNQHDTLKIENSSVEICVDAGVEFFSRASCSRW